jgi:hypothetical protein
LARVELEAAFGIFTKRVAGLELREASGRIRSLVFRGLENLRLDIQAA